MIPWLTGFSWAVLLPAADPLPSLLSVGSLAPLERTRGFSPSQVSLHGVCTVSCAAELLHDVAAAYHEDEPLLTEPLLVLSRTPRVTGPSLASTWEGKKQRQAAAEACVLGAPDVLIPHKLTFFLGKSPPYIIEEGSSQACVYLLSFHWRQCCWAWRPGV